VETKTFFNVLVLVGMCISGAMAEDSPGGRRARVGEWMTTSPRVRAKALKLAKNKDKAPAADPGEADFERFGFGFDLGSASVPGEQTSALFGGNGAIRIFDTGFKDRSQKGLFGIEGRVKYNVLAFDNMSLQDSGIQIEATPFIGTTLATGDGLDVYVGLSASGFAEFMLNPDRYNRSGYARVGPETGAKWSGNINGKKAIVLATTSVGVGYSGCYLSASGGKDQILFETSLLYLGGVARFIMNEKVSATLQYLKFPRNRGGQDQFQGQRLSFSGFYTLNPDWTLTAGCEAANWMNSRASDNPNTPNLDERNTIQTSAFQIRVGIIRTIALPRADDW